MDEQIKSQIEEILARHDRFRNSYFWTSPGSASMRRRMEADNSVNLEFTHNGRVYQIHQTVSCSCKNVYYRLEVAVDGQKKNVRAIKSITN